MRQVPPRAAKPRHSAAAHHLGKHPLAYLLATQAFAIFAIAPLTEIGLLPHPLLGVTFSLMLVIGILAIDRRGVPGRILVAIGLLLLPMQAWRYLRPDAINLALHPAGLACFFLLLSWALAGAVFRSPRIKTDQVLGGIVLYLNIGLFFALAYTLVEQVAPGSLLLPRPVPQAPVHPSYFAYFSFVTLTTVGYGDTLPLSATARSLATLEAALGQLYPAIILARLVSIEVSQRDQRALSKDRQQVAQDAGRAARDL